MLIIPYNFNAALHIWHFVMLELEGFCLQRKGMVIDMEKLVLNHVYKRYQRGTFVLQDCSLQLAGGEFAVLLGCAQSGKSTLLKLIAGIEDTSMGEIYLDEKPVHRRMRERGGIAMVFEHGSLYPRKTVFENIAFRVGTRGMSKGELRDRVENAAECMDLTGVLECFPKQLSAGQRQLAMMAHAMAREPELILMDDPASCLGLGTGCRPMGHIFLEKTRLLQEKTGAAVIYATPDIGEAWYFNEKTIVLNQGKILQIGTMAQLHENPASPDVQEYLSLFATYPEIVFQSRLTASKAR